MQYLAYLIVVVGILGDEVTTRLGLMRSGFLEGNLWTVWLMRHGLWLAADLLVIAAAILIPSWFVKRFTFQGKTAIFGFPLTVGLLRFSCCLWNLRMLLL